MSDETLSPELEASAQEDVKKLVLKYGIDVVKAAISKVEDKSEDEEGAEQTHQQPAQSKEPSEELLVDVHEDEAIKEPQGDNGEAVPAPGQILPSPESIDFNGLPDLSNLKDTVDKLDFIDNEHKGRFLSTVDLANQIKANGVEGMRDTVLLNYLLPCDPLIKDPTSLPAEQRNESDKLQSIFSKLRSAIKNKLSADYDYSFREPGDGEYVDLIKDINLPSEEVPTSDPRYDGVHIIARCKQAGMSKGGRRIYSSGVCIYRYKLAEN